MPRVTVTEYYPAQIKRMVNELVDRLSLCDDEDDLDTWRNESDFSCVQQDDYWAAYLDEQIELRKAIINQNQEYNYASNK